MKGCGGGRVEGHGGPGNTPASVWMHGQTEKVCDRKERGQSEVERKRHRERNLSF